MPNAIEQIYNQITQVLGGTNPSQVLTMLMPGTTLNAQSYAYDTTGVKPAIVQQAESQLTDQMFDIAKISASGNGQKVSSQFLQALSVLVPNFNPLMPVLKDGMRDFLNTPMPANTTLDGAPFTGTFQQYYFKLYDNYIAKKIAWEKRIVAKKEELAKDPGSEAEKYLEWYEQIAEGELAQIDEALGKVLAVFSPSDMDAILGALASGPGGQVYEASNAVKDIQLASPDGGFFYPVELVPNDWFLGLASDVNPINLLKDPEFIAVTIGAKRQALTASIAQVQALLNDMPTKAEIKTAAANLQAAQSAYTDAQNALLSTYADNTATAVEMYLKVAAGPVGGELTAINELAVEASKAKGESPVATAATKKQADGSLIPITAEDVKALVQGQKNLIAAQSKLLTSSQAVADAGVDLASMQSGYFGDLPVILARMQAQLGEINSLQTDLGNAFVASAAKTNTIPVPGPMLSDADRTTATTALATAKALLNTAGTTAAQVLASVATSLKVDSTTKKSSQLNLQPIYDAVSQAVTPPATLANGHIQLDEYALETNSTSDAKTETLVENKKANSTHTTTNSTDTKALNVSKVLAVGKTALAATPATASEAVAVLAKAVEKYANLPQAKQSDTSQRFMELQMSFSSSDMEASSAVDTSASQTSWSVDLFFGSASGSSSSSSSTTAKNSFDSSTEIKVGMKVAKVDIQRAWLDPGIFKLSKSMSRLSNETVSEGAMPMTKDGDHDWTTAEKMNESLFPAFPVAFVIAKDVNITFKATESSLSAVHTVLDSKAATGGGFLCFSASSSSASHSDHSSTSVKSKGTVINISMPGPQILGWYLELTPRDHSAVLTTASVTPATDAGAPDINLIQFVKQLASLKGLLS